jgi:hypothetical protein
VILAEGNAGERLAESPEPFWRHVGKAILAYRDEVAAYWEAEVAVSSSASKQVVGVGVA